MADYFISFTDKGSPDFMNEASGVHQGTSSTATDKIELRFDQTCTRFQVYKALERFERYLKNGGFQGGLGTDLGLP